MSASAINLPSSFVDDFVHRVDIVLYHYNCADGTGGAWPFWRENQERYEKGKLIIDGVEHGHSPPDVSDKVVAIVDFCFPREVILQMACRAKNILILDHHTSSKRDMAESTLPSNVYAYFDEERSGAQIAWSFVYPHKPCPWFIDIIAERDLWRQSSDISKKLSNILFTGKYYRWNKFEWLLEKSKTKAEEDTLKEIFLSVSGSNNNNTHTEQEIANTCKNAILTEMTTPNGEKYMVKLANCTSHKLRSEIGNRLSESGCDFAVTWQYDFAMDEWWCSARASSESPIDLSAIAKQFNRGGGHTKAAAFAIKDGKTLHSYFKTIEIPKHRHKDAALVKK